MYSSLASQQITLRGSFVHLYKAACIHSCSQWTSVTGGGTIPYDSSCEDELVLAAVVLQWLLVLLQEQLSPATSLLCWFLRTRACSIIGSMWTSGCRVGCMRSSGCSIDACKTGEYSARARQLIVTGTCFVCQKTGDKQQQTCLLKDISK